MTSYIETFTRAYAKQAVERIAVHIDQDSSVVVLTFHGHRVAVPMGDLILREDALRRLGVAVDELLGIPPRDERPTEPPPPPETPL